MAYSLRKRLGKRHTHADLKGTAGNHEDCSESHASSHENMKPKLTTKEQEQRPIAHDDLSTTPPPPSRKLRSSSQEASRDVSPPQSLLDRYKNRAAKTSTTKISPVKPAKHEQAYKTGRDTAFSEDFDEEKSPRSSEWVDIPGTPERESAQATRVYDGVHFEMIGKKAKAGEAPLATKSSDEDFAYERRSTRSQTRRQQRADSHDSNIGPKESARSENLVPPSLNIVKTGDQGIPRTPSPQTGHAAPTPSNSPRTLSTPLRSSPSLLVDRSKDITPLSRLSPSLDPSTGKPTFSIPSRNKTSNSSFTKHDVSSTPVKPPPFDPSITHGWQWASPLAATSRPSEPWGWLKVWTCCKCEHLDPSGRHLPAQTMAEQSVCSRLTCGHKRCSLGCKLRRDARFDLPGPFQT